MPNDEMSREEAECWFTELTANPERMSAKMFQEGYEASFRKSGLPETEISPLLRKAQRVYDELIEGDTDDVAEDEMDDVDWEKLEILIAKTNFDLKDVHFRAAALHHIRQLNRCLAALKTGLH
jgi:hypothetical protein